MTRSFLLPEYKYQSPTREIQESYIQSEFDRHVGRMVEDIYADLCGSKSQFGKVAIRPPLAPNTKIELHVAHFWMKEGPDDDEEDPNYEVVDSDANR